MNDYDAKVLGNLVQEKRVIENMVFRLRKRHQICCDRRKVVEQMLKDGPHGRNLVCRLEVESDCLHWEIRSLDATLSQADGA